MSIIEQVHRWAERRRERRQYEAMSRHARRLERMCLEAGACRRCAGAGELSFLDAKALKSYSVPCTACDGEPFPLARALAQQ